MAAVVLLLVLIYLIRTTLFVFVLALLLAYLLSPLVDFLDRVLPASRTRTPALALAYVIFVAALVVAALQIGSRVAEQATALAARFPQLLAQWEKPSGDVPPDVNSIKAQVLKKIREQVKVHSSDLIGSLPGVSQKFLTFAGYLLHSILIPILAFFFLKDGHIIRQHFLQGIDDLGRRDLVDEVMADVHLLLAYYMRALLILSLATLICFAIFFLIMGVPYGLLLAVLAGTLEFIPLLGPISAAAIITLVAAVNGMNVLPILLFLGIYRLFLDYVLSPHVMGSGVELHPLLVLFGVFAGAEVAGIPGTFLSVPVIALLRIVYRRVWRLRAAERPSPIASR